MELNESIKHYRKIKKLSQDDFAKKTYTTKSTVSKWESGTVTPNIEVLKTIAKVLDIDFYKLVGEEKKKEMNFSTIIGRFFAFVFFWVHIDITLGFALFAMGTAMVIGSVLSVVGHPLAIVINNSINAEWNAVGWIVFIVSFFEIPFVAFVLGTVGMAILFLAKQIHLLSLKFFWRRKIDWFENKYLVFNFSKISKKNLKKAAIVLAISFVITLSMFISLLMTDHLNAYLMFS